MSVDKSDYRAMIDKAYELNDQCLLDLIASMCVESERAKQILRSKGYGVTGTSIVETAKQVPQSTEQ